MSKYKEMNLGKIKPTSIKTRKSKTGIEDFASPLLPDSSFDTFWKSLPKVLAGQDLHRLVELIIQAVHREKPVLVMMGAHVIKLGLSPIFIDLFKYGIIQGIALNGAGAIHDVELAYFCKTSEDVASSLKEGQFGMVRETAEILNQTVTESKEKKLGFGEALGRRIVQEKPAHLDLSILGQAYRSNIPVTVHVALGTDIVHQHPSADGCRIGETSLRDFRIWAQLVSQIGNGGVVLLFGSSVILPEVFLKALAVARNIGGEISHFTAANFDMIRHYRPQVNVVERPIQDGGAGFTFIGHHEIMVPLLAAAVKEELAGKGSVR